MSAVVRSVNRRHPHEVEIGSVRLTADGATDEEAPAWPPMPQELLAASLAACSTLSMEAYAERKGWEIGGVVVEVDYAVAKRGCPGRCAMVVRLPEHLSEAQRRRLMAVAATSPVHRALEGETMFDERLEVTGSAAASEDAHQTRRLLDSNALLRRFLRPHRRVG